MGADFSLPLLSDRPDSSSPYHRRPRRIRHPSSSRSLVHPDASTIANTRANRSPTPVARHVALARLADRLTSLGKNRRQDVIDQLHIPTEVLREVRRYTPSNSFGSMREEDDDDHGEGEEHDDDMMASDSDDCNDIDSEVGSPSRAVAFEEGQKRPRRRKIVSFAKYAEMRLFRD